MKKMTANGLSRARRKKIRDRRAYAKAYRASHREEISLKGKIYRAAHLNKMKAYLKVYGLNHKKEKYFSSLLYKYGLLEVEYDALLNKQGGVCAICKKAGWNSRWPHVDHDHTTKKIRGILCSRCNLMLGHGGNDPLILKQAADYLEEHKREARNV